MDPRMLWILPVLECLTCPVSVPDLNPSWRLILPVPQCLIPQFRSLIVQSLTEAASDCLSSQCLDSCSSHSA
ncbi:hypothetical protein AVEN_142655-1 [Araneus ventricosus]|uniref:Uncharacterized protein n=1 Tax=Araneus ventricosus TaxID=182803 RepID=A0A4Y2V3Q7_ARAVE|nr:hypothetical protein AVEN_142655-1 [Araneus ventricosus]